MAPFSGRPQLTAMRATAMEGAWGPWSTEATSAASSRLASAALGNSPRSISQMVAGNETAPISSSIGYPRKAIRPGAMSEMEVRQ